MKFKPLGVLFRNNKIVNHRSFIKVFLQPIFMFFGFCVVSYFDDNNVFSRYEIIKVKRRIDLINNYYRHFFECNDYDSVKYINLF
jgi:hypothetical protein